MKLKHLLGACLILSPVLASAHPGHGEGCLHLHMGLPAAGNSMDLRFVFAALVVGLVAQGARFLKRP